MHDALLIMTVMAVACLLWQIGTVLKAKPRIRRREYTTTPLRRKGR